MISLPEFREKRQMIANEKQPAAAVNANAGSVEMVSELQHIPIEKVTVTPANRIVLATDPRSPGADRFRLIRMALREQRAKAKLNSLVITSAFPKDGKSTVAVNLATVLSERGKCAVLLIEADLHCPTLAQNLNIRVAPGLAECLGDGLEPLSAVRCLDPLQWYILQAGEPRGNPTELLQSASFPTVLKKLSPYFDWILIDTPPLAPISDALVISRHVDATLLVVRADRTSREAVDEALSVLGGSSVAGIVFNGVEGLNRLYKKYAGYYGTRREVGSDACAGGTATSKGSP